MDYAKVVKLLNELASVSGVNVEYYGNINGTIHSGYFTSNSEEIPEQAKTNYFDITVFANCTLCNLEIHDYETAGFRLDITDDEDITEGYYSERHLLEARDKCVSIMRKFVMENIGGIVYRDILPDPQMKATHICDVQRKLDDELFNVSRGGEKVECGFSDLTETEMDEVLKCFDDFNVRELCINLGKKIREIGDLLGITREDIQGVNNED